MLGPLDDVAAPTPSADSGLRCPACDHNLTGLSLDRCPECGAAVTEAILTQIRFGLLPGRVPGWDGEGGPLLRFCHVCFLTWLRPGRFAAAFPPGHRLRSALLFRTILLVAACAILGAGQYVAFGEFLWAAAMAVGFFAAVLTCESLLARAFNVCFREGNARTGFTALGTWRGLLGFFRTFVLMTATLIVISCSLTVQMGTQGWVALGLPLIPWIWWCVCLIAVARVRSDSRFGPMRVLSALPIISAAALFAGAMAGAVCCAVLVAFRR